MNDNYLHEKKNNINTIYLIVLSFLIAFGFYKNGILVFKEFSNNYIMLFKPILFPILSIGISILFDFIFNKSLKLNDNSIYLLLVSMIIPVNTSILLFIFLNLIFNILIKFVFDKCNLRINYVALFKLIIIGVLIFFNKYNYANNLEIIKKYSYDLIDIFIGRGISGVCSSSILFSFLGYIFLSLNKYYKNEIPIISIISYMVLVLIFKFAFNHVIIINSLIIFAFIFIAPLNSFSPAIKKDKVIYSILTGILTFIFTYFVNMYDGVIIAILIASTINYLDIK